MITLPINKDNVSTISLYDVFKNLTDDEKETIYILIGRLFENDWKLD